HLDTRCQPTSASSTTLNVATLDGNQFSLSGTGVNTVLFDTSKSPTSEGSNVYRYFFTGAFLPGTVTVAFNGGSFADSAGYSNLTSTQPFTVLGPTDKLVSPADGSTLGAKGLNNRGYLDVAIVAPNGTTLPAASVTATPGFTVSTGNAGWTIDTNQAPVLVSQTGTT